MFTSRIYNKTRSTHFENLDVFIFAENELSHFRKKFIMGMLIGREYNKGMQIKTYIQSKRDAKLPMFKMIF